MTADAAPAAADDDLDDLLARAANPEVPDLARELAAVVTAFRAELEQATRERDDEAVRRDERHRIATMLEEHADVLRTMDSPLDVVALLLKLP